MSEDNQKFFKLHSIQLDKVSVVKLAIHALKKPDPDIEAPCKGVPIRVGHTEYDPESKSIWVSLQTEIGNEEESEEEIDYPYTMEVEIVGEFSVDDENFPIEFIDDWARKNAPMILQPYLREHVYSLTVRCGFKPLILPLIQVPTLKSGE